MRFGLAFASILIASTSHAQVAVEILGYSERVYAYQPVFAVVEARNEGGTPILLPADDTPWEGLSLEVGAVGGDYSYHGLATSRANTRLTRLEPGARRLYWRRTVPGGEGEYGLVATLRSPKLCNGTPYGAGSAGLLGSQESEPGRASLECWQGEARSQEVLVRVVRPSAESDLRAAEVLRLDLSLNRRNTLLRAVKVLVEEYPESQYTYAAYLAMGGGPAALVDVVRLQPENPLNPWVVGDVLRVLEHRRRRCSNPSFERRETGKPSDEDIRRLTIGHPPPRLVEAYLVQLRADLEAEVRNCPASASRLDAPG